MNLSKPTENKGSSRGPPGVSPGLLAPTLSPAAAQTPGTTAEGMGLGARCTPVFAGLASTALGLAFSRHWASKEFASTPDLGALRRETSSLLSGVSSEASVVGEANSPFSVWFFLFFLPLPWDVIL